MASLPTTPSPLSSEVCPFRSDGLCLKENCMPVKRLSVVMILILLIGFGGGCEDLLNQEEDNPLAALVGTWITTAHHIAKSGDTSQSVDLFAAGVRVSLEIDANGNYVHTWTNSDGSEVDSGTLTADNSTLTVNTGTETFTLSYLLVAGILTITDSNTVWDFDDDGTDEPALEVMVFQQPGSGGDLSLSGLAGTFMASAITVTDNATQSNSTELISRGGFYTLVLQGDGTIDVIMLFPGEDEEDVPVHLTGTASLVNNGTGLHADFPGTEGDGTSEIQVVGTSVILTRSDITWDFGAGEVPATIVVSLEPVTGPTTADLDGFWTATEQLNINPQNPSQTVDALDDKVAMSFRITSAGAFTIWDLRYPEGDEDDDFMDVDEGTFTMVGNVMVLTMGSDDPMLLQVTRSGSDFVVHGYDSEDFDNDGTGDWAAMQIRMTAVMPHTLAEMEGAWTATHWTYVDPENPSTVLNAITERFDIVTWIFDASGGFDVVQSRVDEDIEEFGGNAEIFGNIVRTDDGAGEIHYVVFDLTASAFEFSMSEWTDPFESGTAGAWRTDVRLVPFTPASSTDFEGDWAGTQWELTDPYGVHQGYDMILDGGSFSLTINSGATFSFSIAFPGEAVENGTGTWEIFGDLLMLTDNADGYVSAMQYTVGTGTFSMYSNNDSWDFDDDGMDEPALLNIVVVPPGNN